MSLWSRVALASNVLEQGFGSRDIVAGSQWWKHQILATGQGISDKCGPSALQKRISIKLEGIEESKVFIKRKRVQYEWIDTQAESESKSPSCTLMAV